MHKRRIPHLIILGGFLGSGKTTAIQRLAAYLTEEGIRVAIITNDQGSDLVDTEVLRACGFETREVAGGCFCCRFDALADAAAFLTSDVGPDVLVAEAVGSCTDLAATVTTPMRRLFADRYTIAPLSVLVDPVRARRMLGLDEGDGFSADIEYIYRKQLEEAEMIVMSKCDLLTGDQVNELGRALEEEFPRADVLAISSRDGLHLDRWFQRLLYGEQPPRPAMDLDYEVYGSGEARLGWLNAVLQVTGVELFDGNALLYRLAVEMREQLGARRIEVGHLKMTLSGNAGAGMGSINLVRSDFIPEPGMKLSAPLLRGRIIVNLRGESAPDQLEEVLRASVQAMQRREPRTVMHEEHVDAFSPSPPRPTHRRSGGA